MANDLEFTGSWIENAANARLTPGLAVFGLLIGPVPMRDTLVYTARISPQQRRGEPVPQELLDRVLIAHGYLPPQTVANDVAFQQQADSPMMISRNITESDHEMSVDDRSGLDSRELLTVPDSNPGELAVVPMRKPKGAEVVQRRIRRPSSVSEVEASFKAVEKLGTGRWHDVKLQTFDDAKPRTYVDLKDKWKILVHMARISPQQRRGEPVPHELLDHVMADEHEKDLVEMLQESHPIDISKYTNYVKFCPQCGCP